MNMERIKEFLIENKREAAVLGAVLASVGLRLAGVFPDWMWWVEVSVASAWLLDRLGLIDVDVSFGARITDEDDEDDLEDRVEHLEAQVQALRMHGATLGDSVAALEARGVAEGVV